MTAKGILDDVIEKLGAVHDSLNAHKVSDEDDVLYDLITKSLETIESVVHQVHLAKQLHWKQLAVLISKIGEVACTEMVHQQK